MVTFLFSTAIVAQNNPVAIVDGNVNEWDIPLRYYNSDTKLSYDFKNDDSALYVCIRATEEQTQKRLTQTGFQISLDPKGKKKQKYNLVYQPERTTPLFEGKRASQPSPEQMRSAFKLRPMLVTLSGFKHTVDNTYLADNLKDIQIAMDWDTLGFLNIEYKIPFSEFDYDSTAKHLSLGVILFAMEMPSGGIPRQGNMEGPPPGGGGGMGGMNGGGPPGGGGRMPQREGDMNAMSDLFSEKKVWIKFKPQH